MEQRFLFNQVAALYDAARPGYPEPLYDDVIATAAASPGDAALEIGCGTGKATEGFARRGLSLVGLDPGPDMIAAARRRLAAFPNVQFIETTFEAWDGPRGAFRLVAAAQSWHWVAPDVRFVKAAGALAPGGLLAVFGTTPKAPPSPLGEALAEVYDRLAPALGGPPPEDAYLPSGFFAKDFDRSGLFGPVTHKDYRWTREHTAKSYVDLLRSLSRYQMLAPSIRDGLLEAVRAAVENFGGSFELAHDTHLYMASKKP
jgi:SAM-dependent methyltransferase